MLTTIHTDAVRLLGWWLVFFLSSSSTALLLLQFLSTHFTPLNMAIQVEPKPRHQQLTQFEPACSYFVLHRRLQWQQRIGDHIRRLVNHTFSLGTGTSNVRSAHGVILLINGSL